MAGETNGRSLEVTPTWAVAGFCFVLVSISIIIEQAINSLGKWLTKRHKRALYEALEKIKSELMLLGFISLLLTAGQGTISKICVPKSVASTWHPCSEQQEINLIHNYKNYNNDYQYDLITHQNHRSRLLLSRLSDSANHDDHLRRVLAADSGDDDLCTAQDKVPLMSAYGIHQLHMFVFVLALFHVLYCVTTLALARTKMRKWKSWEMETRTTDYEFSYDPERFRFTRDTTFGRRHLNFWSHYSVLLWTVCFFRQFFRSVPKVDYLTLRNGFVIAHLAPQRYNRFDFHQYINRSLEEDFKVVVGISPIIWFLAILFLLSNTHGLKSYLWLPFIPLVVILLIGTKLQVIITKMGIRIEERYGEVVRGMPLVQPADDLFWFGRPRLVLYLIQFVLFQNAFQLAYLVWTLYEFRPKSCFHSRLDDIIIRTSMGFLIQILCSYVTLPLYALVTQMGSTMKPTVFNERVANAIRNWHQSARRQVRQSHQVARTSPPIHGTPLSPPLSPARLQQHKGNAEISLSSPRFYNDGLRLGSPRADPGPSQPRFERSGPRLGSPRADPGPSQPRLERSGPRLGSPRVDPGPIRPRLVCSISDSDTIQSEADVSTSEFSFDKTAIVLND